jgi:prolyl-tRNA synthetase
LRSTGGILRTREFLMKDLYSFHSTTDDFKRYYENLKKVYLKIFKKMGLLPIVTEASGIGFTKERTHEFQVVSPSGEDTIIFCPKRHFSQNKEIARVKEGQKCPLCQRTLEKARAIEVGNIFPLGTKYSEDMGVYFIDNQGNKKPIIMGCYGIGLGRAMGAIVEVHHDEKGMIWPKEVAPFFCHLIPVEKSRMVKKIAEKLYQDFKKSGIDVLYDDRLDKTPGEKFATSDLIGIPFRLVISQKTLKENSIEFKERKKEKTQLIKIKKLISFLRNK